jgi:cysteinyl-tRNA synthetase
MNNLKLTNSLTRNKEAFKPINLDKISLYACGPTVYDNPHVGNARSLVVFDTLFRVLQLLYGSKKVYYVRNITDVDDKIIEASKNKNKSINDITQEVTKIFHQNCKSLNCLKPTKEPKATEHIKEMIEMTSSLIEKKFAYVNEGHVYFSVSSFKNYGKLSNKNLEDLKAGSRVEISDLKKNPMDFVLWKPSAEKDPGWKSPWGRGRPGWHLECSVMSEKYLGKNFDIHGGGLDLIFPHHENEIAQSCCNNSTNKFANYWLHNGFVTIDKEKMSKSLGNIITITDAVNKYSGQVVRLALLSAHYSQPLDWNDDLLNNQKNILDKWYKLYEKNSEEIKLDLVESLLDDLNTPGFIAKIHELYNEAIAGDDKKKILFNSACRLLGLFNVPKEEWLNLKKKNIKISEKDILKKIQERTRAKNNRNYELADKIRNELLDQGILIEDQKEKTTWKLK